MTNNNNNNNNFLQEEINPYTDRESAISWLYRKGIKVIDESNIYHSMTFRFPHSMTTGKELDIIKQFGVIASIDFEEKAIYVFTATDNVMNNVEGNK